MGLSKRLFRYTCQGSPCLFGRLNSFYDETAKIVGSFRELENESKDLSLKELQVGINKVSNEFLSAVREAVVYGRHYTGLVGGAIYAQQIVAGDRAHRERRSSVVGERDEDKTPGEFRARIRKDLEDARKALDNLESSRQFEMIPLDDQREIIHRYKELFGRVNARLVKGEKEGDTLPGLQEVAEETHGLLKTLQGGFVRDIGSIQRLVTYLASYPTKFTDYPDALIKSELKYWDRKPFELDEHEDHEEHEASSEANRAQEAKDQQEEPAKERKRDQFDIERRRKYLAKNGASVLKIERKNFRKHRAEQENDGKEAKRAQEAKDQKKDLPLPLVPEIIRDQKDPFEIERRKFLESLAEQGSGSKGDAIANEDATSSQGSDGSHYSQVFHYPELESLAGLEADALLNRAASYFAKKSMTRKQKK